MLNIYARPTGRTCDGVNRRSFLQVGAMGVGGLTLGGLFRAEAMAAAAEQTTVRSSHKAVINIHLSGGPPSQDMFDMKPDAPKEFRGEFNPIKTNVPGLDICEHLPILSQMADKFAVIRAMVGSFDDHSNYHTQTGFGRENLRNVGGRPSIGSVVSKMQGPTGTGAPAYIAYGEGQEGYLGPSHKPYRPQNAGDLKLVGGMSEDRLHSRTSLLTSLDNIRRELDSSGKMSALDSFTQRAVGVVTSGKVAEALDLNKEDAKVRERYGNNDEGRLFLTARRLVEAGVRVVSFDWGGWDTHSDNFNQLRRHLPRMDHAMSSLLQDLSDSGMDKDVTIVMWGEFGRSPRVNNTAGRDHWSRVAGAFMAGGGMRLGQAIGSTSAYGEEVRDRPVQLQEVFATMYHNLGIPVHKAQLIDPAGRPQYLLDHRAPIRELI